MNECSLIWQTVPPTHCNKMIIFLQMMVEVYTSDQCDQ